MPHLNPFRRTIRCGLGVALAATAAACAKTDTKTADSGKPVVDTPVAAPSTVTPPSTAPATMTPDKPAASNDTLTTPSGLKYVFLKHGTGPQARAGQTVSVHYTGTFPTGGPPFDSSRERNQPYEFPLGAHRVIDGWDEGVALMHVGDRVIFTVPASLAYGASGMPPVIPPNATLVFDVELLAIR